jgi:hypothetical protein
VLLTPGRARGAVDVAGGGRLSTGAGGASAIAMQGSKSAVSSSCVAVRTFDADVDIDAVTDCR